MMSKQSQVGGDDSTNLQAGTMIVNVGIDERRAREIYQEMSLQLRSEYSQEALKVASERVEEFENRLMPKMESVNGALGAFADPGFQLLLVEAQKAAASTERTADYDLLSELLVHRFQIGDNRVVRAGISRAVEIVDKISDDALLGLTVAHAITAFVPVIGDIGEGLDILDGLFGKMVYGKLPVGQDWLDHLDILDAARIGSFGSLKKISQYYPEVLHGYADVGIEKNSEIHRKAIELLRVNNLPQDILVDHALNHDFVRINVSTRRQISAFEIRWQSPYGEGLLIQSSPVSEKQIESINSIYDMYSQDPGLKIKSIAAFMEDWNKRPNLKAIADWWDNIPKLFEVTSVGKVLAHSNAQRCDKSLPPLA